MWTLILTVCNPLPAVPTKVPPVCVAVRFDGFESQQECETTFNFGNYRHRLSDPLGKQPLRHECETGK